MSFNGARDGANCTIDEPKHLFSSDCFVTSKKIIKTIQGEFGDEKIVSVDPETGQYKELQKELKTITEREREELRAGGLSDEEIDEFERNR